MYIHIYKYRQNKVLVTHIHTYASNNVYANCKKQVMVVSHFKYICMYIYYNKRGNHQDQV